MHFYVLNICSSSSKDLIIALCSTTCWFSCSELCCLEYCAPSRLTVSEYVCVEVVDELSTQL